MVISDDYKALEKFLEDKGYTSHVSDLDGRVVFTNIRSAHRKDKNSKVKLRMIVKVTFGAVSVKGKKK